MFCEQCGAKNNDGAKFCSSCGVKISNSDSNVSVNRNASSDTLVLIHKLDGTNGTPGFVTKKRRLEIYSDHLRIIEVDKDPNKLVAPIKFTYDEIKEIDYSTPTIWANGKIVFVPNSYSKLRDYSNGETHTDLMRSMVGGAANLQSMYNFSIYWTDKNQNKIADEIFQYIKNKISNLYGNSTEANVAGASERIIYSDEKTKEIKVRSDFVVTKLVKIGYELSEEKLDSENTYWKLTYKKNGSDCEFNSIDELEAFGKNF